MALSKRQVKRIKRTGGTDKESRSNRRAKERLNSRLYEYDKLVGGGKSPSNTGYTKPGAIDRHC
jgi:hypothetical protein